MKAINYILILALTAGTLLVSCNKNDSREKCYNGKRDNGETGIDCGGICGTCSSSFCEGNGSDEWLPLSLGNKWAYNGGWGHWPILEVADTIIRNSITFYTIQQSGYNYLSGDTFYTFRYISRPINGNYYRYIPEGDQVVLEIPANPFMNLAWTFTQDSAVVIRKIIDTHAHISYHGCEEVVNNQLCIGEFDGPQLLRKYYYKRGVGMTYNAGLYLDAFLLN